jgi:hypothetical protein
MTLEKFNVTDNSMSAKLAHITAIAQEYKIRSDCGFPEGVLHPLCSEITMIVSSRRLAAQAGVDPLPFEDELNGFLDAYDMIFDTYVQRCGEDGSIG